MQGEAQQVLLVAKLSYLLAAYSSPHKALPVSAAPCCALVRVIGALQQLQSNLAPGYIIENVAPHHHRDPRISQADFQTVCAMIGAPNSH